ncbi:MAG: hypothetical protein KC620_18585, partial [Myxococcales bacterium]|nr:hypothetical protein [Myxococcales bacterium]
LNILITEANEGNRRAEDRRAVLAGADADPNAEVGRAMQVLVTAEGFQVISNQLNAFLGQLDFVSLLGAGGGGGDFQLESATYDSVSMMLVPRPGYIEVRLTVHRLRIEMRGTVNIIFDVDVRGDMHCDDLHVDAQLILAATPDGGIDIQVAQPQVEFVGFGYNIDNVPGFIEDLFEGTVRGMAEDMVRDGLSDLVVPELFNPDSLTQVIDVLGNPVELGMKIRNIESSFDGLTLTMGAAARAQVIEHPGGALPVDMTDPTMSYNDQIDIGMASDLIGRMLHAIWASGGLDLLLAPSGGDVELPPQAGLALFIDSLDEAAAGLDPTTPLSIGVRPLLPPVVRIEPGEKPLVIEFGDMMLDLSVPDGKLASVAVHAIMHMSLSVDTSSGALELVPDISVEAHGDVDETPRGEVKEQQLEGQIALIARLIPAAIADQTFSLGADALPVPITLQDARFEPDNVASFVHIRGRLQ